MLFWGLQLSFPILKSYLFDVTFDILLSIIYYLYAFAFNFCPLKCTNSKELDKIGEILNDVSICIVFVSSGEGPISSRAVFFQAKLPEHCRFKKHFRVNSGVLEKIFSDSCFYRAHHALVLFLTARLFHTLLIFSYSCPSFHSTIFPLRKRVIWRCPASFSYSDKRKHLKAIRIPAMNPKHLPNQSPISDARRQSISSTEYSLLYIAHFLCLKSQAFPLNVPFCFSSISF